MRLTKEKGSTCMRWVSCLLSAVLCLGMGTGCGGHSSLDPKEKCITGRGYVCDLFLESRYDIDTGSFIPAQYACKMDLIMHPNSYCKYKKYPWKPFHSQVSCKSCTDSKCENCDKNYLPKN